MFISTLWYIYTVCEAVQADTVMYAKDLSKILTFFLYINYVEPLKTKILGAGQFKFELTVRGLSGCRIY
jgi:hypothetical protein